MKTIALAAFALVTAAPAQAQFTLPRLASSRAVYDVSLSHTDGAGVIAARGRMAVEFRDTCDGWSTTQRLVADMTDADGVLSRTDFSVSAWESKDGRTMRFAITTLKDGKSEGRQRGAASFGPDGTGHVDLAEGKPAHFMLPKGAEFPTAQMVGILGAAQGKRRWYKHVVFQGGDKSDIDFSTAVLGKPVADAELAADRAADRSGLLHNVPAWPALISFYPLGSRAETPDYEIATHLFANGINGSMSLIYPDYTLHARLTRLEPLKPGC